ncbi:HAD family hydrolase [Candidatus Falkowbacteria bacterium]|nr:HAD family hydrolase [Candidatus Falkowbacteria bacterium]
MIIIFDFDYTLFNPEKLRQDIAKIFPERNFSDDYQKYFKDKKISFSLNEYRAKLREESGLTENQLDQRMVAVEKLLKNSDKYLFPEALSLLEYYRRQGDRLVLLTFGNKSFQEMKVDNLGIKDLFDEVCFVEDEKKVHSIIESLKDSGEKILIINDNAKESLEMMRKLGGQAELKLIKGPYSGNVEHQYQEGSLSDLLREITGKKELTREIKNKR